jgi:hypothetical protein
MVKGPAFDLTKEIVIRSIKIVDIVFITVLYFLAGYGLAILLDALSEYFYGSEFSKKSRLVLIWEGVSQISLLTVISYIGRNIIQAIPFPLEGVYGFEHLRVKEVMSGGLLTMFTTLFFYNLQNKLLYIRNYKNPSTNSPQTLENPLLNAISTPSNLAKDLAK